MKLFKIILISMIICTSLISQETVEEMMKQMQSDVQNEIDETNKAVKAYISEQDSLFAEFLKKEWELFKPESGIKREEKPKPVKIPSAPPIPKKEIKEETIVKPIKKIVIPEIKKEPVIIPKEIIITPKKHTKKISLDYYNRELNFEYDPKFYVPVQMPVKNKKISEYWNSISRIKVDFFLEQIKGYEKQLKLNDWGVYQLTYQTAQKFNQSEESTTLFTWYILTKLGYKVNIGYGSDFIALLAPAENMLYSTPFLTLSGEKYFVITSSNGKKNFSQIYTYKTEYSKSQRKINYEVKELPLLGGNKTVKNLKFKYKGVPYTVNSNFNDNIVEFFKYYPQTDFYVYFQTPISQSTIYSMIKSLKPIVENKSESEAVNIILCFVQTAFNYKTDNDNFGREKPLFPEETLFYKYSDCEDRSILFAHLVEKVLDMDVVGLKYKGHMATAVKFESNLSGDKIVYKSDNYLVCDPTYINAHIGQAMPQFKGKNPEIIAF